MSDSTPLAADAPPRRRRLLPLAIAALLVGGVVMAFTSAAQSAPADIVVYDDAVGEGFADWSWAEVDLAATGQVAEGITAIEVDMAPWGGLSLGHYENVTPADGAVLRFAVHGGANGSVTLNVVAMSGSFAAAGGGQRVEAPGNRWTTFEIPLADLGVTGAVGGFWWQTQGQADPAPIFIDDVRIVSADAPEPPPPATTAPPTTVPTTTAPPTTAPPTTAPAEPVPPTIGGETTVAGPPTTAPGAGDDWTTAPVDWVFTETFDGDPASPSQDLLPDDFEFVATHRSHPGHHFSKTYRPFLVDHAENCAGPNPEVSPLPQRYVETRQDTNGSNPDETFFICKNHMMSSMGDVEGYSVSAFWPRQEFDFGDGGFLEFEVNINDAHAVRSWWEIMIAPRDQLKVGSGPVDSPIDETYPEDRIVLDFRRNVRTIKVGTGALAPEGWLAKETERGRWDWAWWRDKHPEDPALDDRRVRRTMRIWLDDDTVHWAIETADGGFDTWNVDVPGGLPFDQGLVLFKTHAYNPTKDGNTDTYTFHWDNIRFDGPDVGRYDVYEADDVVYLQRDGDRRIGETETVTIELPADLAALGDDGSGTELVLFGQLHQPKTGQVLLSINGGPAQAVDPYQYDHNNCHSVNWKSFRLPLDPTQLQPGENTLTWTIGPRPDCLAGDYLWDGFSVKFLQIQADR
ncbi:MAG: hypothetical protein AAF962_13405 [Actinomycetota bacterium]